MPMPALPISFPLLQRCATSPSCYLVPSACLSHFAQFGGPWPVLPSLPPSTCKFSPVKELKACYIGLERGLCEVEGEGGVPLA